MNRWGDPPPPDSPAPRSYWAQPPEADALGPGQLIRTGWRLYRATPRRFLLVAFIPELIRDVLALPGLIIAGVTVQGVIQVLADYLAAVAANPEAYRNTDPRALQGQLEAQLQAALVPQADLATFSAIETGLGVAIGLIGSAALTGAALAAADGRAISVAGAFRLVAARGGLIRPIVALGVGWVTVSWLPIVLRTSTGFQAWAGAAGSPRSILLGSLLGVLALLVVVGVVIFAVRWALFIPVVLVEALGVGPGLARAAQLSRGIRVRLGLAIVGILILNALGVGIASAIVAIAVGLSAGSVPIGLGAFLAVSLIGNLLCAPLLPATLGVAYRERTREAQAPPVPEAGARPS